MFDLAELAAAVAVQGAVARVVIAAHDGSSPREAGAAMLVWADVTRGAGQSGTIGGGALEWEAAAEARAMLADGGHRVRRVALGPALGQCCGGAVTLVTEVYDAGSLPVAEAGVVARSVDGRPMPLAVKRLLDRARGQGVSPAPLLVQGWFVEPVTAPARDLWIWGAGHVGRALVSVLAPLPGLRITWVDVAADRFPDAIPEGVTALPVADAARLVAHAPKDAEHLVLTYSHALDLELCHRLLSHGFARAGVIGSATKWARFRSRLAALGHGPADIARIDCPIGDPALGKHPQAIAIGVAQAVLSHKAIPLLKEKAL
ncbi:xanthine dehydrogenase accessory protein XdhC [Pseudotabrizicola alkalilacus]|uniref:Xanthine dehydrogenase accessory protein XdhC n=1 Tax=Pseudotabrizicola alkalilacus TaxID=2305252 RepID=A0A411Z5I0_9RHOB|nr:xanthine dehydrogenase accessory protein XdhC [Pseudotabrizicola alkalilacus]RGP38338.1 xanthine dehydrogenase accessory protein XdhC [Pseudotabrizicola alkalilacus]